MSIIFTAAADADLDEIFAYTAENYPDQLLPLQSRIREVMAGIEAWPRNAGRSNNVPVSGLSRCSNIHFAYFIAK